MIPTLALIALMTGICELGLDWVGHQNMGESWGSMSCGSETSAR